MRTLFIVVIVIAVILIGWYFLAMPSSQGPMATSTSETASSTAQTQSDGTITFTVPADFGMATDPNQILVSAYIPPCSSDFTYCLYYNGTQYEGTNFEAAGLRIVKRADLSTERTCLDTPPEGYEASAKPSKTASANAYSTSVFPTGDAGAGHMAEGALYRLFVRSNSSCYEFETRIGSTQYANYPAGSIKEFTAADKQGLMQKMQAVLSSVTIGTTTVAFPAM